MRASETSARRYRGGVSVQHVGSAVVVEERTGVFGMVGGLQSTFINCRNITNPQAGNHTAPDGYPQKWACGWADVAYALADEVIVVIGGLGTTREFMGAVFGMAPGIEVRCENLTRGGKTTIHLRMWMQLQWSCTGSGLEISPGDQVQATIVGRAEPEPR
jgi:hypothetical protein